VQGCADASSREPPVPLRANRLGTRAAITTSYRVVRRTAYRPAVRRPLPCHARLPRSASYCAVKAHVLRVEDRGSGRLFRPLLPLRRPAQPAARCRPDAVAALVVPRRALVLRAYHHRPSLLAVPHSLHHLTAPPAPLPGRSAAGQKAAAAVLPGRRRPAAHRRSPTYLRPQIGPW
jgi:hypothetical protein